MLKGLHIFQNAFRTTFQELRVNKTRSLLSLAGVAFGIFCIIGVLATVNSLERNIQDQVNSLGSNSIYIDKWDYSGGPDKPWWKFRSRPRMKYEEAAMVRERSGLTDKVTYLMQGSGNVSFKDDMLEGAVIYGINQPQIDIQPIQFESGRYFSAPEFNSGAPVCLIGYVNAENLFGNVNRALGRQVDLKGKKLTIVGIIRKEGKNFIGWDYDNCLMLPYQCCKTIISEDQTNPILIVKGKAGVTPYSLTQELRGIMRQIRRLSPTQEDNFALNSVEAFSKAISQSFVTINIVGSIIGGISLIVGMFGIANIMFVTVRERRSVIGLKKAVGAKKSTILFEFLLEASVLCILGGAVGLVLVYILTLILSGPLDFPVYVSVPMMMITVAICLVVGILAGILPASQAAKMDPVQAIRS